MSEYNGWANRDTWNVSLWIGSDEPTYRFAVEFMKDYKGKEPYKDFCIESGLDAQKTPDGIKWVSDDLDYKSLDAMMLEHAPEK
jgi:hypothetical protein